MVSATALREQKCKDGGHRGGEAFAAAACPHMTDGMRVIFSFHQEKRGALEATVAAAQEDTAEWEAQRRCDNSIK